MSMIKWCGDDRALHMHQAFHQRKARLESELAKADSREKFLTNLHSTSASGARCEVTFPNFYGENPPTYKEEKDPTHYNFRKGWAVLDITPSGMAKIHVQGCLVPAYSIWQAIFPEEETSYECINDALKIVEQDDSIIGAVMVFDSGGGYACGMEECAANIRATSQIKPVSGYTGSCAFSAAYGLMSATYPAYAYPSAEVGSIGTYFVHFSYVRAYDEAKIDPTVFRAGEFKALGLPQEELTDAAKEILQQKIDESNGFFVRSVARYRNLSLSDQAKWGEGKTFFAQEAQNMGLIDNLGSFKDLFDRSVTAYYVTHNQGDAFAMHISPEKLARIGEGEAPSKVLTPAELKQYQEQLESVTSGEATEEKGKPAQEGTDEGEQTKDNTGVEEGKGEGEGDDKAPKQSAQPSGAFDTAMMDRLLQATSQIATLSSEKASLEQKLAKAEADTTTAQGAVEALRPLAEHAVSNLQLVLGKQASMPSTTQGLVDSYVSLRSEQAQRFPSQQRSRAAQETVGTLGTNELADRLKALNITGDM